MKDFLSEDFLLENDFARRLYFDHAKDMPIIDYHNHLPPKEIAENRIFNSITEAWLEGDHYKWRAMRAFGIDEEFITGNASDQDKFRKWAETVPFTIRNPLFHWTHLELRRYFGIEELLNPDTADHIFNCTREKLSAPHMGARGLLDYMNVEYICTTDDPADDLNFHKQINATHRINVFPTFRPDNIYAIDNPSYTAYLAKLSELTGIEINSLDGLLEAASARIDYFHEAGGRLSDHGFEELYLINPSVDQAGIIFRKALESKPISKEEVKTFKMTVLLELSRMYHAKGWVQQFHLGAIRNNNQRMLRKLGPDTGFDSIGDYAQIRALSKFFDTLDATDQLAKTIIYNLNPSDNEAFATVVGNFNDGSVAGKMQFGSGWWFLDQKNGIEKQIDALSNMGLLSQFVGMLTDSRSFLSFPRHEYFRRILCNMLGKDVENGELPADESLLGGIIQNICYNNAKRYFNLG